MGVTDAIARILRRDGSRHSLARPEASDPTVMFSWCLDRGLEIRPQYLWGALAAGRTGMSLGIERLSAIEFGVAGGNGLVALEQAAALTKELLGVSVEVFGFDTGRGMPPPADHRDVPWVITEGLFPMDEAALRARLRGSELVIGPVAETVPEWMQAEHPPLGLALFDLDYYSSTMDAFSVFDGPAELLLPRVVCYFDDVFGFGWSDFNGERAAIADFDASHDQRKIGKIHGLRYALPQSEFTRPWPEQMYLAHIFDHPRYNAFASGTEQALSDAWLDAHRLAPE